jgi:hypothetical protein
VHFRPISPIFDRPLAIINDTRLLIDQRSPSNTGCIDQPLGRWPMAAELDTFLFARGGAPIKCYPAGSVSRPGIFGAYDFDTVGTRRFTPTTGVPLSLLVHYPHLVWLVDAVSALIDETSFGFNKPATALRAMSAAGRANTLASYIRLGGEAWLAGGGCMTASLEPWNSGANDRPRLTFSSAASELVPGRLAYDFVHWRSQIQQGSGAVQITQAFGRLSASPGVYASMPAQLQLKSAAAGDSMPAWRVSPGDFYLTFTDVEGLTLPNPILEDQSTSPFVQDLESELDTLYVANGGGMSASPIMTVYHGRDNTRLIMSGFNLWSFRKSQLIQLVDAVLQGMWGMTPRAPATAARQRGTLPAVITPAAVGGAGGVRPAASSRPGTAAYPPVWRPRPASR